MKGIIFDFNGTMVWDVKYQEMAWKSYFKKVTGKNITNKELEEKFYGVPMRISLKEHLFKDSSIDVVDKHAEEKESLYRKAIIEDQNNFKLAPGLKNFLDELKNENIKMTIATASIKSNVDFFIKQLNLERWFDVNDIVYDNGQYKDKREMFLQAAKNIEESIENIIIFEDSTAGIRDAKEIGCKNLVAVNLGNDDLKYKNIDCIQVISDFDQFNRNNI